MSESPSESPQPPSSSRSRRASRTPPPQKPVHRSKLRALFEFLGQLGGIGLAFIPVIARALLQIGETTWRGWKAILPKLRTVLPAQLRQLSDWLLTAIALALLIGLIGLPLTISRATATVPEPVAQTQPVAPQTAPPARSTKPTRQLAAIRNPLIRTTAAYPGDWTDAIQLSTVNHRLQVQVNSVWDELSPPQQKALTSEWLRLAQKRAFTGLEVIDPDGTLLARSPVVGTEMILFVREPA